MIVLNDLYDYGLKIYQDDKYFKFSLDSILLAEFIETKKNQKVLDLCTGNIPVPLILLTKNNSLQIDAVEIQEKVFNLASQTIEYNNIKNLNIYNANIKEFDLNQKYDIISCNPPYFKYNNNKNINENEVKRIARHEITVNLDEIFKIAKNKLKENGCFYLVHRPERLTEIIEYSQKYKLGIKKIVFVFTKENEPARMILVKAVNNKKDYVKIYQKNISKFRVIKISLRRFK